MNNRDFDKKKGGRKELHRLTSTWYLLKELKNYRVSMIAGMVAGLCKEISVIAGAGICAYMVASAVSGRMIFWKKYLILLCICAIARAVFTYADSYIYHDVAYHALVDFRNKLYENFQQLCPEILLDKKSGQIATTLMNDVEQLEWFYGHTAGVVVVVLTVCIAIAGFLTYLHWSLGIAGIVSMIVISVVPFLLKNMADEQGKEARFRLGEANSVTIEGITGMSELLSLNWQERYLEKNHRAMEELTKSQVSYARRSGTEAALLQLTAYTAAIVINIIAANLRMKGLLEIQWYTVVGTTVWLAFGPLMQICSQARNFGTVFAAADRVYDILKGKGSVQECPVEDQISIQNANIEFKHVYFRYKKSEQDVLKDVSFSVKEGTTVTIVGESGAGKTTCANLLARLWDVRNGSIRIGNADIRKVSLQELHQNISVVLQDVYLFNISILDNIRLGKPDASMEEVEKAAKLACIHDFIVSLPQGYETVAGERGIQMSGGQRQRIAIARALLQDAPILIMDEAVSSLDTITESEIQEMIQSLSKKKTILMIAHRLSTIQFSDQVVVMKNGRVVQEGLPDVLMNEKGFFRDLIQNQI